MKWFGIDKYHGSYEELRSGSKWENMKAQMHEYCNQKSKTLFVTTVTSQFMTQNSRAIFQYSVC